MKYIIVIIILLCPNCIIRGQDYNFRNFIDSILERYILEHPDMEESLIVQCYENEEHYYMDIFIGEIQPSFLSGAEELRLNDPKLYSMGNSSMDGRFINFDPDVWKMAFHKDGSLCKMFTYKTTPLDTLDDYITNLARKYLGGYTITKYDKDHVYMFVDSIAEFYKNNDDVDNLIASLLYYQEDTDKISRATVVINLIVDIDGKSQVSDFVVQSGDKIIDGTAMRVAKTISETYIFKPASHRGELVRAYFPLTFTKCMFLQN